MKDKSNIKESILIFGATCVVLFGILASIGRGCSMLFNNRTIDKPAYHAISKAKGISGHIEYVRYSDGSQEIKNYPGLGHRFYDSELIQDLDGDGKADRIRRNGSEIMANRLTELLVREYDYEANKKRFDEANRQLQELSTKYPMN